MDLISVIIPVYNVEPYLVRCVESVQHQTYKNLEIILVDDESPDNCPKMCDDMALKDNRIKVVHKKNGGLGFARNSGLEVATGDYVMFIDSDDWISHTRVETLYNAIIKGQADAAIGTHTNINQKGETSLHQSALEEKVYEKDEVVDDILLPIIGPDVTYEYDVQINCSAWRSLYKMDVIRKNSLRFISERYAVSEDMYFNVDFFYHANRVVYVNDSGYFYFKNLDSISRRYDPKGVERTLNFYKELSSQVQSYGLDEKVAHRIDRTYLMKIRVELKHLVASDLSKKDKLEQIKYILSEDTTKNVLSNYPIDSYIFSIRVFSKLMRDRKVHAVYWFIKLREVADNKNFSKKALKLIGIGKQQ
ncbi:MAG: glycosyltransferase family 2 protein [Ruminococcaceae bacterium]|nr:glycosyltransferase family 2 protein [Oscillospiraceae bacterium]